MTRVNTLVSDTGQQPRLRHATKRERQRAAEKGFGGQRKVYNVTARGKGGVSRKRKREKVEKVVQVQSREKRSETCLGTTYI